MTRFDAELQAAALVDEIIAFDLNAAAAAFERLGQTTAARSLRERAADLLAEAGRLQAKLDEVLPLLGDSARFLHGRSLAIRAPGRPVAPPTKS
ncbi:hypothetical protein [Methylobacterium soli]|uniref:Uncharacterized protein n=1 Tax=Methylobacterium soli TaxID=553447 RepID=A0A6L3SR37_9HYPH|nr:hypothetical protein [Methylobacterium soli]KAB1070614.1 hypothetical protein F6X53_29970 [Methylobacterium soli]GJE43554.1 hypothetical protein AEGHOMDF_2733 [Methylobacterium soli]